MNRRLLPGVLAVGLLAAALATTVADETKAKDRKVTTVEGTLEKVDPSAHRITVTFPQKKKAQEPAMREFSIGKATKFIFYTRGGEKEMTRQEAYKHEQFKEGAKVTVLSDADGRVEEVRVGAPRKAEEKK